MTLALKRWTVLLAAAAFALPAAAQSIRIGFHAPLTGFAAADGKSALNGAQLAVDRTFRNPELETAPDGRLALVEALVAGDSRDESSVQAIERLRTDVVPEALAGSGAQAYVTGETAEIVDYRELMEDRADVLSRTPPTVAGRRTRPTRPAAARCRRTPTPRP